MKIVQYLALGLLLVGGLSFTAQEDYAKQMAGQGLPVVNSMLGGTGLRPRSFRASEIVPFGRIKKINVTGLETLFMSGSSQPSPNEMDEVKKFWGKRKVHWVALRKEEVWAVEPKEGGAVVVSQLHPLKWWSGEDPRGKATVGEIHAEEANLIKGIPPNSSIAVFGNHDIDPTIENGEAYEILYKLDINAAKVYTLQQLVEKRGMVYHRGIDNKFGPISWECIDQLVGILRNIPEGEAVHFHCKKGQSRTTIGMVIYDMMRNAGRITGQEIIKRNGPEGLGGASLESDQVTAGKTGVPYKFSWEATLLKFYDYCVENQASHYELSFSEWCRQKGIEREPEISLEPLAHTLTIHNSLPKDEVAFDPGPSKTTPLSGPLVLTVLDEKKLLPNNLRSTLDHHFHAAFNTLGLDQYHVVASSQPTANGAKTLFKQLSKAFEKQIIDVDLRHDEHWIVFSGELGHDVNNFETFAELGKEMTSEELVKKEQESAAFLSSQKALKLHVIKEMYPKEEYGDKYTVTLAPTQVQTEKEMVEKLGVRYVRIPAPRFGEILAENVDKQIQLRLSNPEAIIYYHCKNGKSRTTLALCIEDMMMNADRVSMVDIVHRQHAIGGVNLFDITAKDPTWHQEREFKRQWLIFLARFHAYAKAQKGQGFKVLWSEWSAANPGLPADVSFEKHIIDKTQG